MNRTTSNFPGHLPFLRFALRLLVFLSLLPSTLAAEETLTFSANRTESIFAEGREQIILNGNALVESDAFEIRAVEIEIYGEDQRFVRSDGGVEVYDSENDLFLTSDQLFLDRSDNFIRATGSAYMEDRPNNLVVKGSMIQNWDELDLTEISVNVRILGEDYTARGQFARYRRESETLELSGTPEVFWKGDEYRATRITIDLANDEIELIGEVRATVRQAEDDEEAPEDDPGAAETPAADDAPEDPR